MTASTCYLTTLLSRVSSLQLGSHNGRSTYSPLHVGPTFVPLSSSPPRSSVIAFWRPRRKMKDSQLAPKSPPPKKKTSLDDFMEEEEQEYIEKEEQECIEEEEDEEFDDEEEQEEEYSDEDALEAFFSQLEKDINNHDPSQENVELKEEDVVRFEKELAQALGEGDLDSEGNEEEDLIRLPQLKTWQMRKLARALKIGRHKASIKKLSEEVGLERATVLEFLRNPPPNLLLMSDSLPDEPGLQPPSELDNREMTSSISTDAVEVKATELEVKQQVRPAQQPPHKRLKRVQIETLERVYSRTKRPTDEMINSIVHVTNLSRKTVVKWFEEKRVQDVFPHQPLFRAPYRRQPVAQTASR